MYTHLTQSWWKHLPCLILLFVLTGCQPLPAQLDAHATKVASEIYAMLTAEADGAAEVEAIETPAPTPQSLSDEVFVPSQIFEKVAPAVAFIETEISTGSGLLISNPTGEENYILTNAHVLWPHESARVVLPDGTEFMELSLVGWDQMLDIALLGPVESNVEALPLIDGEVSAIGSDVYLIGYPGEADKFPEPTLARGLISRLREWETAGLTYFQTDAAIAGGQSGGVLVSQSGEVIGISGLSFNEAFALAASASDLVPHINRLMAEGSVERSIMEAMADSTEKTTFGLDTLWHESMYLFNLEAGDELEIVAASDADVALTLRDSYGEEIFYMDDTLDGEEVLEGSVDSSGIYFLAIEQFGDDLATGTLESNLPFASYDDPDDGLSTLELDSTTVAYMDYAEDIDVFIIELNEGDIIELFADSTNIDPMIALANLSEPDQAIVSDDDGGGGMFGTNASLVYQAPNDGPYQVIVQSAVTGENGGYYLVFREAAPDAVPVTIEATDEYGENFDEEFGDEYDEEFDDAFLDDEDMILVESDFGPMGVYLSDDHPFSIQHPEDWIEQYPEEGMTARFVSQSTIGMLVIAEEDMLEMGFGDFSLSEYSELVETILGNQMEGLELEGVTEITTAAGEPALLMDYTALDGIIRFSRFIYMSQDHVAFNATIFAPSARFEELAEITEYLFSTFEYLE